MNRFDLLFIALFLTSVITLSIAALSAIRGRGARALRILCIFGICAAAYVGIVAVTSLFWPQRVLKIGDPDCFDDWCISVENVNRTPEHGNVTYTLALRLSSRAGRISQRENGVVVYLADSRGRRYDPVPDQSATPFNVLLPPQESIATTRTFRVTDNAQGLGLVITHEGGFPIGWFIIGYETWFRKPTIIRLT